MESKDPGKERKMCRKLNHSTIYSKTVDFIHSESLSLARFPKEIRSPSRCWEGRVYKSKLQHVYGGKAPVLWLTMLSRAEDGRSEPSLCAAPTAPQAPEGGAPQGTTANLTNVQQ